MRTFSNISYFYSPLNYIHSDILLVGVMTELLPFEGDRVSRFDFEKS